MRVAQDGDEAAYATLLRELLPVLRRTIGARWPSAPSDEVEDLVQEVLISVHRVRGTYDPARPFLPWLLAIVRNRMADAARKHGRTSAKDVDIEALDVTSAGPSANADAGLEPDSTLDVEALKAAVAALPPGQRQAITLLKLQEMSLNEAADASGVSVGALKVATHRAMLSLRRMLKGRGDTE